MSEYIYIFVVAKNDQSEPMHFTMQRIQANSSNEAYAAGSRYIFEDLKLTVPEGWQANDFVVCPTNAEQLQERLGPLAGQFIRQ